MSARLWFQRLVPALCVLLLQACGGGASTTTTTTTTPGGGSGGSYQDYCATTNEQLKSYVSPSGQTVSGATVTPVYMDTCLTSTSTSSPALVQTASNIPYVSVYLCAPGTNNCAWIDHLQLDTGSIGLRVLASALPGTLLAGLSSVSTNTGSPLGECYNFVSTAFWGGVRLADVKLGGTPAAGASYSGSVVASGARIQVLNDPALPAASVSPCGSGVQSTAWDIGANGVLGIGLFQDDCQGSCGGQYPTFWSCPSGGSCTAYPGNLVTGLANPVWAALAPSATSTVRPGVVLALDPAATILGHTVTYPATSTSQPNYSAVAGYLTYGVPALNGTGGPAHFLVADSNSGRVNVTFAGVSFATTQGPPSQIGIGGAFIDSGSNAYFYTQDTLANGGIPQSNLPLQNCPTASNFACVTSGNTSPLAVGLTLATAATALAPSSTGSPYALPTIQIQSADSVFAASNGPAFADIAALTTGFDYQLDLGVPFLFGRPTWFAIYDGTSNTPYYGL